MSTEKRGWRRSPISPLAHAIRMDAVRQANIYPTCRLDKSGRAVYEPEDIWAKRAALFKPNSRSSVGGSRSRAILKQKVIALSTTGVTKENMESVDHVKETVAVLMKSKERAADIGTAERRVLQPQVARRMARMTAEKRAAFEGRVQEAVERIVYGAKRRYTRRQESLDQTGIFHPEANAHRVHTQFWADLNNRVDITKIENAVWASMSAEADRVKTGSPSTASSGTRRKPTSSSAARTHTESGSLRLSSDSLRPSSKDSSHYDVLNSSKGTVPTDDDAQHDGTPLRSAGDSHTSRRHGQQEGKGGTGAMQGKSGERAAVETRGGSSRREKGARTSGEGSAFLGEESDKDGGLSTDEASSLAPAADKFVGIPGYEDVGHVPTLEEFRSEWPKMKARSDLAHRQESGYKGKWKHQPGGGGKAQHGSGSVVNDLSKRDEVFRHFKNYYDKAGHSGGRAGDALYSAGVNTTGLLQPDFDVIDAVGRHTAQAQESRRRGLIGEGLMSAPSAASSTRASTGEQVQHSACNSEGVDTRTRRSKERDGIGDGFTNVFLESMQGGEIAARRAAQGTANAFAGRGGKYVEISDEASYGGREGGGDGGHLGGILCSSDGQSGWGGPRGRQLSGSRWGADSQRVVKAPLEGSSNSAELQARLEASWCALFVPVRMKLDFLQKYSTLERALELPTMVQHLETAGKAVPLREKVTDFLHRMEDNGEPMSAASMFSEADQEALFGLDCWVDFAATSLAIPQDRVEEDGGRADDEQQAFGGSDGSDTSTNDRPTIIVGSNGTDIPDEGGGAGDDVEAPGAGVKGDECKAERIPSSDCAELVLESARRQAAEAVLAWLRSIDSLLVGKCAQVCDAAWYDLGETITYKGRPVAHRLPPRAMEAAAQRREDREEGG